MRYILENRLYDTEKSKIILNCPGGIIYQTAKGNFFMVDNKGKAFVTPEQNVRDFLSENIDKYIEVFGEPEEA